MIKSWRLSGKTILSIQFISLAWFLGKIGLAYLAWPVFVPIAWLGNRRMVIAFAFEQAIESFAFGIGVMISFFGTVNNVHPLTLYDVLAISASALIAFCGIVLIMVLDVALESRVLKRKVLKKYPHIWKYHN